ncbi:cyclin-like protein, partial [Ochromonadaceae sp. CCMP2298]
MGKQSKSIAKSSKPAAKAVAKPAAKPAREPPAGTRAALIAASARRFNTFPAFVPPSTGGSEASDSTTAKEVKSQRRSASIAMREQLEFRKSGGMVAAIAAETDVGSGAAQMEVVVEEAEDAEEAEEDNGEAERLSVREKKAEALCRIQCWCRRGTLRRKWTDRQELVRLMALRILCWMRRMRRARVAGKCPKCGSRDIDFQESSGQSICVSCGTALEENTIVSSIEFQESGDRSHVIGQYISATCSKPYSGGGRPMGRHGDSRDPRDTTLVNARRSISHVASSLRLPPLYIDRAYRLYQLALQRNFIFGRKQLHVVATCLYIICRQERSPHLLIDFSDALQINVYVLGKSFLQFSKLLTLNLPVVDPSLYIHRYAARLELGDARASVVGTALRVISRLKKDWTATGRRPDGICALAMLVSARAHGFDVNQDTICKLFRVSPDLLRRRIRDFRSIPSAQLTLEQFHTNDAEAEFDPPAYVRAVVRGLQAQQREGEGDGEGVLSLLLPRGDDEEGGPISVSAPAPARVLKRKRAEGKGRSDKGGKG